MQNVRRISRWLVENDPTWEKSIDSNLANLSWIKKGTNVKAVCSATSMFCDIVDESKERETTQEKRHHRQILTNRFLSIWTRSRVDDDLRHVFPTIWDACHIESSESRAIVLTAINDKGKAIERWRRKVSGLKSLDQWLHDSGTAGIETPILFGYLDP